MNRNSALTEVARKYAAAYAAHYSSRDLTMALDLYTKLIASHANAPEAAYGRKQVQNIVNAVVPTQELFDAQKDLALVSLAQEISQDAGPVSIGSPASELPE